MTLWDVYVGTFTHELAAEIDALSKSSEKVYNPPVKALPSDGIEHLRFNDADGSLWAMGEVTGDVLSPQYLDVHPTLPVVYAAEFSPRALISSFAVGPAGVLRRTSREASSGDMAVSVGVHPSGSYAYLAHWGDGAVTAHPLAADGSIAGCEVVVPGEPKNPDAFQLRHHQVRVAPSGSGIVVTDVGRNEITAYRADAEGRLDPVPAAHIRFPAGAAPRHVEFHPSSEYVYVDGEVDSHLYVLSAKDWIPIEILSRHSTLPAGFEGHSRASELALHPDGRTLFVGNRGADLVSTFALGKSGEVELVSTVPSGGESPRAVRVDPSGRFLLVANKESDAVVVFGIDDQRRLQLVGPPAQARSPSSLVFVEADESA